MASEQQIEDARHARELVFNALREAAYNRNPCPRYDQLAAISNRHVRTTLNQVRALHKEGRIIIHRMAHNRIVVEVDGRLSRASIFKSEKEKDNAIDDDCDIVVDEKKNFAAFLAKFNLRCLRFEDSKAACKPERPWTKRPEPRTSSGVAQYG